MGEYLGLTQIIYAPECFRYPTRCSLSKTDSCFKCDWGRKSRPNFGLVPPL